MGGFFGMGGTASQDRNMWKSGMDKELNVYNTAMPWARETKTAADASVGGGLDTMRQVKDYFKQIFAGTRSQQLAGAAPEINAINAQSDAQRRAEANLGMGRTGGTAAINASADTNRLATIDNTLFGARSGAAQAAATVGNEEANIGLQQLSAALRALGMSDAAIQHYIDSAQRQQEMDYTQNRSKTIDIANLLSRAFTSLGLKGMADVSKIPVA